MPSNNPEELLTKLPGVEGAEKIEPLAGDASSRLYYRATLAEGDTCIVMQTDPEALLLFQETTVVMSRLKVDTPHIIAAGDELMTLEDCGDMHLQNWVDGKSEDVIEEKYKEIIDDLVDFQLAATETPHREEPCFSLTFDYEKLSFETGFTQKHFIEGFMGQKISSASKKALENAWRPVIEELAAETEVLCHRDFHSRNIILLGDRRVWIDFQDARMGRMTYDLASLLWDPYVNLTLPTRDRLAEYYFLALTRWVTAPWDALTFRRLLYLSALQRIYKALGTYGYQTTVKGVDTYLPYIPIAAADVIGILENDTEDLGDLPEIIIPLLTRVI